MAEDVNRSPGDTSPHPPDSPLDPSRGPEASEVGVDPNPRSEASANTAQFEKAPTHDAEVMKTSDADYARAMADADADYAKAMTAADADYAKSLGHPLEPTSDTEPAVPEHELVPEPRVPSTQVEPKQFPADSPAAEASVTAHDRRGAAPPVEQTLISGAAPPAEQDLIRESPQTPREFAVSGSREAARALDGLAGHAETISTYVDAATRVPGAPNGVEVDSGQLKEALEASSRWGAAKLNGLADKLEGPADPDDLGQGPLIRGGSSGKDVERELDPAENSAPPEDGGRR